MLIVVDIRPVFFLFFLNLEIVHTKPLKIHRLSGWRLEFIKENKKVRKHENTLSTKKAIKKKKEKRKENSLSTKKAINKK